MIRELFLIILFLSNIFADDATDNIPVNFNDIEKVKSLLGGIDSDQMFNLGKIYIDTLSNLDNKQKLLKLQNTPKTSKQVAPHFNVKQAQSVTYEVRITDDNNITKSAKAVAISSNGTLVTAYSNIESHTNIKVIDKKNNEYAVRIGKISVENDLAYIHIDANNIPFAKLAGSMQIGEDIYMLSYENLLLTGILSQIKINGIIVDMEAKEGTHGGGVFNEKNELVAILLRKDLVDKTSFAATTNMFTKVTQKYEEEKELLNSDSDSYDYSFCDNKDELIIWNKYAKSPNLRMQELHALFLGLCKKVKNRDLTMEHAQFIFERSKLRLFGK